MKLTGKQKEWFKNRVVEVGQSYMFPRFGFFIYTQPDHMYGEYIDTNPFTRSLDHERFLVNKKVNGFCRGNFEHLPKSRDIYIEEEELQRRDVFEKSMLYLFCYVPLLVYNLFAQNKNNK